MSARSWRWRRGLEARLRAERPQPTDSLVARIAAETGSLRPVRTPFARTALAAALTLALSVAFASVGGVGAAAAAAGGAASAVVKAASPPGQEKKDEKKQEETPATTTAPTTTTAPVPAAAPPSPPVTTTTTTTTAPPPPAPSAPTVAATAGVSIAASSNNNKVTICHRTGSETNPYVEITVSENAVNGDNGHGGHEGDIIPAPAGGCPDGGTPGEDQYKPGKGCGDKNHAHFKEGQCKEKKDK